MRNLIVAGLLISATAFIGGCGEKVPESLPLTAPQQQAAVQKQGGTGGVKAGNGGGVFPVTDPPPPAGAKLGPPTVGTKGGN